MKLLLFCIFYMGKLMVSFCCVMKANIIFKSLCGQSAFNKMVLNLKSPYIYLHTAMISGGYYLSLWKIPQIPISGSNQALNDKDTYKHLIRMGHIYKYAGQAFIEVRRPSSYFSIFCMLKSINFAFIILFELNSDIFQARCNNACFFFFFQIKPFNNLKPH